MNTFFKLDTEILFEKLPMLQFSDHGPLYGPIKNHSLKFTDVGKLELTTRSAITSRTNRPRLPAGTIYTNNNKAILKSGLPSLSNIEIEFRGLHAYQCSQNFKDDLQQGQNIETSIVDEIFCQIAQPHKNDIQIEYISNLSPHYSFPDSIDSSLVTDNISILHHKESNNRINIKHKKISNQSSRSALFLDINGIHLYLIYIKDSQLNNAVIVYEENQSEDTRNKIRNCISFCLGKRLNYHGYIILDNQEQPIEFSYISNRLTGLETKYPALPPAPLGEYQHIVSHHKSNQLINALFKHYDDYNLKHVLWGYWHALEAPTHIAGVHFGACIEAFQSAYIKTHKNEFSKKLIQNKNSWGRLRKELSNALNSIPLSDIELQILQKKLDNLNQTPQSIITNRFFQILGMNLSDLETNAFKERNHAAHGKITPPDNYHQQMKDLKILRCLFHRILLSATQGCNFYIDYYSYDFPWRALTEPIEIPII